jgi:hypothetical protein
MAVTWGTLQGFSDWIGEDQAGNTKADLVLAAARETVISLLGYDPRAVADDTATFSTDTGRWFLPAIPVTGVSAITVDGVALATTDYAWTAQGEISRAWTSRRMATGLPPAVTVTYSHGYDPVPDGLVALLYETAEGVLSDAPGSLVSETLGSWSATYASQADEYGLSPNARMILDRYRLWTLVS